MKTIVRQLMKGILVGALLGGLFVLPCAAQDMGGIRSIRTPEELARWFRADFKYSLMIPDSPQTPDQMMASKKGDCDDFAVLASAALSHMGIRSDIVIIKYKGLNIYHAICIWQDKDGTYSFISNKKLRHTGQHSIIGAISFYFPDWESISFVNEKRESLRTVSAG